MAKKRKSRKGGPKAVKMRADPLTKKKPASKKKK